MLKQAIHKAGVTLKPICPHCDQAANLVKGDRIYPNRKDTHAKHYWLCVPCDAYVGCHDKGAVVDGKPSDGTLPFGRLANHELRMAKQLGIDRQYCHIGMFDTDLCDRVVDVCVMYFGEGAR